MKPRSRTRLGILLGALLVAGGLVLLAVLEGDVPEEFSDAGALVSGLLARFGAPASLGLLYAEESGIPLPVPGDVYVAYLGSLAAGSALRWVAGWLGIITVVVGGATNLYLVSRRWGSRLVEHRLAPILHLEPHNLARVEAGFRRWGAIAIIFGRHLPGLRIPITVAAGITGVRYRVFAPSVAVSTAVWAGVWMYLGSRFGLALAGVFAAHRWIYLAGLGLLIVPVSYLVVRAVRIARSPAPAASRRSVPTSPD